MSDSKPKRVPKTQPAFSGGPPVPPKKTARGLEDQPLPPGDRRNQAKCEYCGSPAVASEALFLMGFLMGTVDYRWCAECQRDLKEFPKIEVPKGTLIGSSDEAAVSRYRAEMQCREQDFMRSKVVERKGFA